MLTLAQAGEDEAQVRNLLQQFLAANPEAREVRAAHARLLVNEKRFEDARQQFLLLDKQQPDNVTTLYALGVLSTQLQDPAAAERYFARFVEVLGRNPDDERDPSKALLILSQLAEERGDLKAAVDWLDKLPESDEKTLFGAQLRRAQLLGKGGDLPAARRLLASLKPAEPAAQGATGGGRGADPARRRPGRASLYPDAGRHQALPEQRGPAVRLRPAG
ncbi:lipopolysaccharide assembly protein LapB [Massilia sp. Dwa41.01b]|uniref:tetratricopeptide repeat protein n=1 Tax=Massilia sp. Dwa41.01b TaxID=2709302 RepID=UPI001E37EDD6|nr:tetratricopeptide repeat protein [Massilia sp. Dwa41.01b]